MDEPFLLAQDEDEVEEPSPSSDYQTKKLEQLFR